MFTTSNYTDIPSVHSTLATTISSNAVSSILAILILLNIKLSKRPTSSISKAGPSKSNPSRNIAVPVKMSKGDLKRLDNFSYIYKGTRTIIRRKSYKRDTLNAAIIVLRPINTISKSLPVK